MKSLPFVLLLFLLLTLLSVGIGVSDLELGTLFGSGEKSRSLQVLLVSRIPRTLAVLLAGASLAVAGLIMQMLARNRFVEPSTAGTAESAGLGVILIMLLAPHLPVFAKMLIAAGFALIGTFIFLSILNRLPLRSPLLVPLIGLVLSGIISSITVFLAYRFQLLQSLTAWSAGDFSSILRGRYELLWVSFALTIGAYFTADRLTVAGLGEAFTTNLGLNHRRIVAFGLILISLVTASVVVTVGIIPFIGLIVPNMVSMYLGDNARRSLPWVALIGALFVLFCDILGRVLLYPYEIPVGTIAGVLGCALFLILLLRKNARVG